jgi:hypothetical protein
MMSKNLYLKVNMTLNEEGSAVCTVLKAKRYKPDIKYQSADAQLSKQPDTNMT